MLAHCFEVNENLLMFFNETSDVFHEILKLILEFLESISTALMSVCISLSDDTSINNTGYHTSCSAPFGKYLTSNIRK